MIPTYEYIYLSQELGNRRSVMEPTVKKSWGYEIWFENNDKYCGKLLFVEKDKWSSNGNFHYHKIKDESFFIIEGSLLLELVGDNNEISVIELKEMQSTRVFPATKHRFTAISEKGCKFIEVSTTHLDEDSYRCYWDKERGKWNDILF